MWVCCIILCVEVAIYTVDSKCVSFSKIQSLIINRTGKSREKLIRPILLKRNLTELLFSSPSSIVWNPFDITVFRATRDEFCDPEMKPCSLWSSVRSPLSQAKALKKGFWWNLRNNLGGILGGNSKNKGFFRY